MTRRIAIDYSLSRSETIRNRLELLLDDPPLHDINCPPAQSASPVVHRVPRLHAPTTLRKTENDQ